MADPFPFVPNRRIVVTACAGCPFAHRDAEQPTEYYCAIGKALPTVTAHVMARGQPADCPVLVHGDYRVTTAR